MEESIKLISHKPLEDYVTVLAIYDDPPQSSSVVQTRSYQRRNSSTRMIPMDSAVSPIEALPRNSTTLPSQRPPMPFSRHLRENSVIEEMPKKRNESSDVVEVTTLDDPPSCGLQVVADESFKSPGKISGTTPNTSAFNGKNSTEHKRSLSVDHSSPQQLSRNHARKSRFTDAFLNAKERLDQKLEEDANTSAAGGTTNFRHSRIVFGSDTVNTFIGVEVSAVPDPECPNRILAVEVMRIEEGGRIYQDDRIKVGDQIIEINGHPCSEMSLAKVRRCLRDLEVIPEPSLTFARRIQRRTSEMAAQHVAIRPVRSALQQANTSKIGETIPVTIQKSRDGFGFGFAGRVNAAGEHLYYVTTLKPNGASYGLLKIGDRLLKIGDLDLSGVPQSDITKFLKSKSVGDLVTILTSRVNDEPSFSTPSKGDDETDPVALLFGDETDAQKHSASTRSKSSQKSGKEVGQTTSAANSNYGIDLADMAAIVAKDGQELVVLDVALKDSPSAGLGLSLKAQKIYNDNETVDSGLYIRKLLHGSAAYKDGRLRMDDRLVGIENVNLLKFDLNAEALEAFTNCLSQMRSSARVVRIVVARQTPNSPRKSDKLKKAEFVVERNGISSSPVADEANERFVRDTTEESESEASIVPDDDAFVRDTVVRKSISEKRPLGAHNDPSHLQTYQRIKHFRQTSAPAVACGADLVRSASTPGSHKSVDTDVSLLRANRRRSVGVAHLSGAKRRLSFAPISQNVVDAVSGVRTSPRDKFVARHRPLTVYNDGSGGGIGSGTFVQTLSDDENVQVSKRDDDLLSTRTYESKTLPLKSKNSAGDSFKKSSRFFDFFKLSAASSGKKSSSRCTSADEEPAKDDETKENVEKDASPGRRSVSFDQMGFERSGVGSRESRLATSLDQAKSREIIAGKQDGGSKIASSLSQPILRQKAGDSESAKGTVSKENSNMTAEKRNRRKSTGSGLLKLFQKSAPSTATLQLHAEDEKAAARYTEILEERKKLEAMDEAFRREYGLISRHNASRYSSSPKADRRAPPPSYHQFVSTPSQFSALQHHIPLQPPPLPMHGVVKHKRGHSAHELPYEGVPMCQDCCQAPTRLSNNSKNHKNINASHNINQQQRCLCHHNYDNDGVDGTEHLRTYSNVAAADLSSPSSPQHSRLATIGMWNAAHSPTSSMHVGDDHEVAVTFSQNPTSQYCNTSGIDMLHHSSQLRPRDRRCSPISTPQTSHATNCHRHQHMEFPHQGPSTEQITRRSEASGRRQAWNMHEDSPPQSPQFPATHQRQRTSHAPPPYDEIVTMTRSTRGLPVASPRCPRHRHNYSNTISRHDQAGESATIMEYQNIAEEPDLAPVLCDSTSNHRSGSRPSPNVPADRTLSEIKCHQCELLATNSYSNLTNSTETSQLATSRNHPSRSVKAQETTTRRVRPSSILLLMKGEQENKSGATVRWQNTDAQSLRVHSAAKDPAHPPIISPFHYLTDSSGVVDNGSPSFAYSTDDNVTNISLGSPINVGSPVNTRRLGNVSFNSANLRPGERMIPTNFPRSNSRSLNYRTRPKTKHNISVNANSRQHSYQQTQQQQPQSTTLPHAYCKSTATPHTAYNVHDVLRRESSHRRRSKMRRAVASAVFYDDSEHL